MCSGSELHEAEHQPLIARELFTQARALLEGATLAKRDHGRNPDYLLRGLLRCACCGSSFTPASTRKGRAEYRYYRCIKRDKEGKDACPSSPLPAGSIEDYVLERLRETTADGSLATEIIGGMKARAAARRKDIATERQRLPAEIASLSDEGKRLVETIASVNGGARRLLDERLGEVAEQLARCEARLAAAERELANIDALEVEAAWVAQCLTDFDKVWDVLTAENRARLLRVVVQRVEVDEPANQVSVHITDLSAGLPEHTPISESMPQEATP